MVTFAPLKGFGKIGRRLLGFALEIELVNTALGDH
jgi:hypothetical protein